MKPFQLIFAALLSLIGFGARAAVPEAITTAITTMQTDAVTVATAFLVAIITVAALLFMRRGVRS